MTGTEWTPLWKLRPIPLALLSCLLGLSPARAEAPLEHLNPVPRLISEVAGPSPTVCSDPGKDGRPHSLEILLAEGSRALARHMLTVARDCYGKALDQAPESYEARMGLGLVFLYRAREEKGAGRSPDGMIKEAKGHLGQAYLLRQDPYEPLYYLAEAAALEGRYEEAISFLEPLLLVHWKEGPVYALLGELAERGARGVPGCPPGEEQALCLYRKAFEVGWPESTYRYAGYRISGGRARAGGDMESRRFFGGMKLGGGGDMAGTLAQGAGFAAALEVGIRLMKKRPLYLVLPFHVQVNADQTRLLIPLSLQYDFELPRPGLYLSTRLGGGFGYNRKSQGDKDPELYGGVIYPELGVKYTWAGRVNLGADVGFPVLLRDDKVAASIRFMVAVGSNF